MKIVCIYKTLQPSSICYFDHVLRCQFIRNSEAIFINILFYTFKYIALCLGKHIYNDLLCRKRILSQHTYINKIKEEKRSEMKML